MWRYGMAEGKTMLWEQSKYGSSYLRLGPVGELSVHYIDGGQYEVLAFGKRVVERFAREADARRYAEQKAKEWLNRALRALNEAA